MRLERQAGFTLLELVVTLAIVAVLLCTFAVGVSLSFVSGMSVGRVGGDAAAFTSRKATGTVAGRPATGADLARTVAFLLSDEAATISGTVIDVGCFAQQGGPMAPAPT